MKRYSSEGKSLDVTMTADKLSGDVLKIGDRIGVLVADTLDQQVGVVDVKGIHTLPKSSAAAIAQGTEVYWDDTAKGITEVSTSNTLAGYAAESAVGGDSEIEVNLNA